MTSLAQRQPLAAPQTASPWPRTIAVAAVAAGSVFIGRTAGALDGLPGMVLAGLLVIGAPIGRTLSRRLLVAAGLLPWLALLWWIRLPLGGVGRVTIILSIGTGLLCGYVAAAPSPRARLRQILPEFGPVDLAPPLAGLVACWPLWPWLNAPDTRHALAALLRGWDNSAHFAMTDVILREGAVSSSLPLSPDGSAWGFPEYPQYFHTAVAAVMELLSGPVDRTSPLLLLQYTHALGIIQILGLLMVVAAVTSLPAARQRPRAACLASAALTLVYAYGPGLRSLEVGHSNFLLAAQTIVVATALGGLLRTERAWPEAVALGGAVVATANEWIPLAALAGIAFWPVLVQIRSGGRGSRVKLVVLTLATTVCSLAGVPRLLHLNVSQVVTVGGEVQRENINVVLAVILLAIGTALAVVRRQAEGSFTSLAAEPATIDRGWPRRAALVPISGVVLFATVLAYQLMTAHHGGYYSIKLLLGTYLAAYGVLAICLVHLGPLPSARAYGFISSLGVLLLLPLCIIGERQAGTLRTAAQATSRLQTADRLLSAVEASTTYPRARTVYLGTHPGDLMFMNGDQWFAALTESWTASRSALNASVPARLRGSDDVSTAVRSLLAQATDVHVMVNQADLLWLRHELAPQDAARVISWGERQSIIPSGT